MTKAKAAYINVNTKDECREAEGKAILGQRYKRDIVKLIRAQDEDRLEKLIPIRRGRISRSAHANVFAKRASGEGGNLHIVDEPPLSTMPTTAK